MVGNYLFYAQGRSQEKFCTGNLYARARNDGIETFDWLHVEVSETPCTEQSSPKTYRDDKFKTPNLCKCATCKLYDGGSLRYPEC